MSFPEIPLLLYPSHAKQYGVDEALLYCLCHQLFVEPPRNNLVGRQVPGKATATYGRQVTLTAEKWESLTDIWSNDKLDLLVISLVKQNLLEIKIVDSDVVIKELLHCSDAVAPETESVAAVAPVEETQILPVYDIPPAPPAMSLPRRQQEKPLENTGSALKGIGPAPSFGGSTGWKKRSGDALHTLFEQQEVLNKQLHPMSMGWKPSAMFYSTLKRSAIPAEFSQNCIDEFILFYCDKNTKERSWDQKFLAWVKRAWVKQQTKDSRNTQHQQQSGSKNENSQRDTREKRKRITAAIMDIHDTSW